MPQRRTGTQNDPQPTPVPGAPAPHAGTLGYADQINQYVAAQKAERDRMIAEQNKPPPDSPAEALIKAFIEEMNKPLDLNDPYVAQIVNNTASATGSAAYNRGIGGPMAVANTQKYVADAQTGLGMQRKELAARGLGLLSNHEMNEDQLRFNYDKMRFDAQNRDEGQGWGQIIGGGLGTIAGGVIGSIVPGVGTAAGMSVGGALGGGIGGMFGQSHDNRQYLSQPGVWSGYRGGSGRGNSGYGGGY